MYKHMCFNAVPKDLTIGLLIREKTVLKYRLCVPPPDPATRLHAGGNEDKERCVGEEGRLAGAAERASAVFWAQHASCQRALGV